MTVKVGEIACFIVTVDVIAVKVRGSLLLNLVHYSRNVYVC